MEQEFDIACHGWMRKKGSRVNIWGDRYFVLRGPSLFYYLKEKDLEPKGQFALQAACRISHIRSDVNKKRSQFLFSIIWPADDERVSINGDNLGKDEKSKDGKRTPRRPRKNDDSKKANGDGLLVGGGIAAVAVGGVVVGALTAGIGLVAGMVVVGMGAVAGGGAVVVQHAVTEKEKYLTLACESHADAQRWVQALETQIRKLGDSIFSLPFIPGRATYMSGRGSVPQQARLEEVSEWMKSSIWRVSNVVQGLRIYEQINRYPVVSNSRDDNLNMAARAMAANVATGVMSSSSLQQLSALNKSPPCLRLNISMSGSSADVFMAVMREKTPTSLLPGIIKSLRVLETVDNSTDVVHVVLNEIFVFPTWTSPRDFCVLRYWHQNADGSYAVCMDSTFHHDCPLVPGYVRAELHLAYLISAPLGPSTLKDGDYEDDYLESLLTVIAQVDPKGWVWRHFGFQTAYLEQFLLHVLDIRDSIDCERFMQVQFDPSMGFVQKDVAASTSLVGDITGSSGTCCIANTPPPVLPAEMWAEPDASTFKVRGKSYCQDKVKTSSGPSLFKLLCVDMFETEGSVGNIASHPRNRVFQALQRGDPSWTFVINIMVPGPPFYSFVAYMEGDKKLFEADTAFARIARTFFNGNDDEFRNNRFKLIPKVIDGNIIIKMAVKDTPTLLGNKLKQYYYKGDNYFELDVDVGSSSVARHVVGLAMGYSKAIVVDMAFCLQGNDESELPEVVMGCCTCVHVDVASAQRL